MTFTTGTRRYVPQPGGPVHVPLLTHSAAGDVHEGYIAVPVKHVGAPPHSNERMAFEKQIEDRVGKWLEWKAKKGLIQSTAMGTAPCDHCGKRFLNIRPHVCGPYDPPSPGTKAEGDEDVKWYWVTARFQREWPVFISLNDFLYLNDEAERYGVPLGPRLVSTPLLPTKAEITADEPAHNPMKFAEARRNTLGLRRKDLLLGPLSQPL